MGSWEEYREKADECRELAAKCTIPSMNDQWLKLAAEWDTLAATCKRPTLGGSNKNPPWPRHLQSSLIFQTKFPVLIWA
jgi:hypothetical protein